MLLLGYPYTCHARLKPRWYGGAGSQVQPPRQHGGHRSVKGRWSAERSRSLHPYTSHPPACLPPLRRPVPLLLQAQVPGFQTRTLYTSAVQYKTFHGLPAHGSDWELVPGVAQHRPRQHLYWWAGQAWLAGPSRQWTSPGQGKARALSKWRGVVYRLMLHLCCDHAA